MGFIVNDVSSDTFMMAVLTNSFAVIPSKRTTEITIPGRDGVEVIEDGYNNRVLEFKCTLHAETIAERRKVVREVALLLSQAQTLVYDLEPSVTYTVVQSVHDISSSFNREILTEEFNVKFVCKPTLTLSFDPNELTWDDADFSWDSADIPWIGNPDEFVVQNGSTFSVTNLGTHNSKPVFSLTGVASSISFGGMTLNDLDGTVYIDCEHWLVYEVSGGTKTNRMQDFTGQVIELAPGENEYTVSGSFTGDVTVAIENLNAYL